MKNSGFWIKVILVRRVKDILDVEMIGFGGNLDIGVRLRKEMVFKF